MATLALGFVPLFALTAGTVQAGAKGPPAGLSRSEWAQIRQTLPAAAYVPFRQHLAEYGGEDEWIHTRKALLVRGAVDPLTLVRAVESAVHDVDRDQTAHGFLTLSLLPTLRAASDHKIVGYGNATNYGSDKLRFVSPVPASKACCSG